ncbi:CBS domain-containing protein [Desulfoscipio geothermicus]|uniref:CBS domain-containing protein n=1 Tax=Desulfoscipio geothermicus DSM 3669 TaxID=1121426 RepID=A0A1I6CN68_9FIRM|nr:CBS domain-containing protein [Desulfoscipio geothermicus]SFQ94609.1 CBS domain-containing protein [Desulfoscipio geothermicus DSM 3669]
MCAKRVMDIMLPAGYPIIRENLPLRDAWEKMCKFVFTIEEHPDYNQGYLMVYNDDDALVGMVTMREMLKTFNQRYLAAVRRVPGYYEGNLNANCIEQYRRSVREIMCADEEIMLKSWDSLVVALRIMLKHRLEALPVINIYHKVIGIVRIADVYEELGLNARHRLYWLKMA